MDKFKLINNITGQQLCVTKANEDLLHLQIIDDKFLNVQYFISKAEFERLVDFVRKS